MDKNIKEYLGANGYSNFKEFKTLTGTVICGTMDYLTTRGIVVGLNEYSYERRYCYQDRNEATEALNSWDGVGHPKGNWIKLKGVYEGQAIDYFNPDWK